MEEFAAARRLNPFALRRWVEFLGGGDYRLMTRSVRDAAGKPGVFAWRGEPDCPNALINTTDQPVKFGESALDEMCFVILYYYPSKGVDVCLDNRCGVRK